jgi:hypothetical protein
MVALAVKPQAPLQLTGRTVEAAGGRRAPSHGHMIKGFLAAIACSNHSPTPVPVASVEPHRPSRGLRRLSLDPSGRLVPAGSSLSGGGDSERGGSIPQTTLRGRTGAASPGPVPGRALQQLFIRGRQQAAMAKHMRRTMGASAAVGAW